MEQTITLKNFPKLTDAQKGEIRAREEFHAKANARIAASMTAQQKAEFEALRMMINDIHKETAEPLFDKVFKKDGKTIA